MIKDSIIHVYLLQSISFCFTYISALTVRYLTKRFIGDYNSEVGKYIAAFCLN